MVTSQNLRGGTKCLAVDNDKDKSPKKVTKVTKKAASKRASFALKPHTPVSSQDVS